MNNKTLYDQNGYVLIDNFLEQETCNWMVSIFKNHANNDYLPIYNIQDKELEIKKVIDNPKLISMINDICGIEMGFVGSMVHLKEPGTRGATQAWQNHQDASYLDVPWGTSSSVILFLEDCSFKNGGMFVYTGSHLEPILSFTRNSSSSELPGNSIDVVPDRYEKKELIVNAGSLYIQHGHLIHGSVANVSKSNSRTAFGMTFIKKGVSYNKGTKRK